MYQMYVGTRKYKNLNKINIFAVKIFVSETETFEAVFDYSDTWSCNN